MAYWDVSLGSRVVCLLAAVASACGGDDAPRSKTPPADADADAAMHPRVGTEDYGVSFEDGVLVLRRRDEVLVRLLADGLQLGRVDAVDDSVNYDPYPLAAGLPIAVEPEGLAWLSVESASVLERYPSRIVLQLEHERGRVSRLTVTAEARGRFSFSFVPEPEGDAVALLRVRPLVDAAEAFYGLGEYFDTVNHRGQVRAMQLELDGSIESTNNEAHVPIPFVIGTRGWGLFVESPFPGAFDVAAKEDDRVEATFAVVPATRDGLRFHLFAADHPLDVTRHYYDVTGYPKLPARWALGPWVWRDENDDQAQVERDALAMRNLDLAATAIWIDRPYATGVNTFDFDAARFPDPAAMVARLHDVGLRVALWHTPYLDTKDDATAVLRAEAETNGFLPPRTGLLVNPWGAPVDLTNGDAFDWWQRLIRRYTDLGVEGFKLDYAEDVVPGLLGSRNVWRFSDDSDERTMHSRYQLLYHRVYAETLPPEGGFLLCRGGTYGDQKYASVIWPGDLDANFAKHRERVDDVTGSYTAVGGLPAAVVAGISLGPSGFPFYGSDTGGYRHCPPDKETFMRWFQQTALGTVMQVGTSCNDVAWEPTPGNGFDAELLDAYREYARLHLRLFPYLWSYAQRLAVDGRPLQRALGLAYPEIGEHPSDTYLLGDHLLVAPVVERGQRSRAVTLPPGVSWVSWWTGESYQGGQTVTVDAPLDRLPLFLRATGVVPLLRPTIDTLSPVADPTRVDSYATTPGKIHWRIAVGDAETAFDVFDGGGITVTPTTSGVTLSTRDGAELALGSILELVAFGARPASVVRSGAAVPERAGLGEVASTSSGWAFDARGGGTLHVAVPAGDQEVVVVR